MRDKHLHIAHDSELLRSIHRKVEKELNMPKSVFRAILWSKMVFYVTMIVLFYWLLYVITDPMLFIAAFVAFGFSALLFAFNFAHDLSHGTVFRKEKWDDLGFILIYALNGAHGEAWKQRHVESHHFAPNVEHYDSDLEISDIIRVIPNSKYLWFHKFQHIYAPLAYTTYSLFWILIKDFTILYSGSSKSFGHHLSFWVQKVFYFTYLLALPIMFSHQSWTIVVTGFLVMHMMQSLFLLLTFFMTHHVEGLEYPTVSDDGVINTSWVMNQIKSSNDMHPYSFTANFILGGFNNHIAHHLFPHIHHIYYPQLNRILYRELLENGIEPNQTSYWGGIVSHLRLLRKMGNEEEPGVELYPS